MTIAQPVQREREEPPADCGLLKAAKLIREASADPAERLGALRKAVRGKITFTTSFGIEDQALTHLIFSQELKIDLVTIDTGRLFPSTYKLWAETEQHYGTRIRSVHPGEDALAGLILRFGADGFYRSKEARLACCAVRKVEPLARALVGAEAWVTGLRADQSPERRGAALARWDEERGLIKFSPLFDWTRVQVHEFCADESVPINALHAEGYLSIGCEPCTRAVEAGEGERAGRWWWEHDKARECGLHVDKSGRLVRSNAA
jgi:phosphoadenosine phosphosulfate reductase